MVLAVLPVQYNIAIKKRSHLKKDVINGGFLVSRASDYDLVISRDITTQHRTGLTHL